MNFAALVSAAGIFPPNEYAEKKEGWQEPGIFRNSPTLSFKIRR